MAGSNWAKYLMPDQTDDTAWDPRLGISSGTGRGTSFDPYGDMDQNIYNAANRDPYASFREALGKDPFIIGNENQGTLFDPYEQLQRQQQNQRAQQINAQAPLPADLPQTTFGPRKSLNRPNDLTNVIAPAANFNPDYQTPPFVSPQQASAPRPRVAPSAPRRVASPVTQTGTPVPVSAQPSYTRQEPIDFAGLLSGAARKGGGAYGDFGAAGMLGPEERAAKAAEEARIAAQPKMPTYDYGPMTRYQEYLKAEPDRDKYKPTGWSRVLNAAAAGVQGYNTGDVGQGIKLGEYLNQQPYENAFKKWQSKGTRVAADATMAETRYKNQVEAFNKQQDNIRADRLADLTAAGVDIRRAQYYLDVQKAKDAGYKEMIGPDGNVYMSKVVDGQMQYVPTGMLPTELTAIQKLEEGRLGRQQSDTNSQRSANTSIFNTGRTIDAARERQSEQFGFTGAQNDATRTVTLRGQNVGAGLPPTAGGYPTAPEVKYPVAPGVSSPVPGTAPSQGVIPPGATRGPRASSLASPLTTITQAYPEFNNESFVKVSKGPKGESIIDLNQNDATVKEAIKRMSGGDLTLFKHYTDRWLALRRANGL